MTTTTEIEFTEEQRAIWDWFSANSEPKLIYNQLSDEDRAVFSSAVKYQSDPDAVVRSRTNYVDTFFRIKQGEGAAQLPYTREQILQVVLLKARQMHAGTMKEPQHESDIRAYVYSVCLTPQEQRGFLQETYEKDVELSKCAVQRFAQLVVEWMVKLHVVEEKNRKEKEKEIFEQRFKTLEETYEKR